MFYYVNYNRTFVNFDHWFLEFFFVNSDNLDPRPPAKITTFIFLINFQKNLIGL